MKEIGNTSGNKWLIEERPGPDDCLQAYKQLSSSLAYVLVKIFGPTGGLAYGIRPCG